MFRSCLFVVGVRIYSYFRSKACFDVHSLSRYFFTCVTARAGGLIVWRTFFNLSKMMYRLAFSGSRHFVSLSSFSFVDIVKWRVSLWSRLWNDRYLCAPRYEATTIKNCVCSILKWAGICVNPIIMWAGICASTNLKWAGICVSLIINWPGICVSPIMNSNNGYLCEPWITSDWNSVFAFSFMGLGKVVVPKTIR